MHPQAFSLVTENDPSLTFAVGLEIIGTDGQIEATITFRPESNGHHSFGMHTSAEAARALFSRITPVTVERERTLGGGQ